MHAITDAINAACAVVVEQYARKKDAPGQRDLLSGEERRSTKTQRKLRWITLKGDDGSGGAHVQIDDDGNIVNGPKGLADKGIKNLNDFGKKDKPKSNPKTPKDESDRETETPPDRERKQAAGSLHEKLADLLSDGRNRSYNELRDGFEGEKLASALEELEKDGRISIARSRTGDHSYWMTDEQREKHGEKANEKAPTGAIKQNDIVTVTDPKSSYFGKTGQVLGERGGKWRVSMATEDSVGNRTSTPWHFDASQLEVHDGTEKLTGGAGDAADASDESADTGVRDSDAGDVADAEQGGKTQKSLIDEPEDGDEPASPREAAAAETRRLIDEEYAFARQSKVRNAGEDLLGSARHKANAWRGLADAEENGTAEELVTRTNLTKNEPHGLAGIISDEPQNHLSAAAMALALNKFPAKPGPKNSRIAGRRNDEQKKKDRQDYVDSWNTLRSKAEEIARTESDPLQAAEQFRDAVKAQIQKLRGQTGMSAMDRAAATDKYNNTANLLVDTYKAIGSPRYERRATAVTSQMKDLQQHADANPEFDAVEAAMKIAEGVGVKKAIGIKSSAVRRLSPADLYVATQATRTGGRDLSGQAGSAAKATEYLTADAGMRGVQFGNSMTDDEREHHVRRTAEAVADLADVLGMKPEDVSLDGTLGLAFGARGKGSASAHYEPGSKVINLTRKNGVGTLAHEWGHALDHYLTGGKIIADAEGRLSGDYMSGRLSAQRFKLDDNGRPMLDDNNRAQYDDQSDDPVWKAMDGVRKSWMESGFRKRVGAQISKMSREKSLWKNRDYWNSPHEMLARSFERHVQHALGEDDRENTYLSGLPHEAERPEHEEYLKLWPTKDEAAAMAPAFESLLEAVREKRYGTTERQTYSRAAFITAALNAACEPERYAAKFDESKHPRASDGRFGNKAGEHGGKKKPGVAGQQMGLFDEEPSGQKTLFNVVKPSGKKKPDKPAAQLSLLERITDDINQRAAESKPISGQREMFSRQRERYELAPTRRKPNQQAEQQRTVQRQPGDGTPGWQKVGGAPVFVNGDGKITKGCPGLKGEHVADIIDESDDSRDVREARQAHAKAEGLDGKEYTAKHRRQHSTQKAQQAHRNAKAAAKQHGVSTTDVLQHMPAAHAMTAGHDAQWEQAKQRARQITGLTAGRIAAIENSYRDHSTVDGFDANAREFAAESGLFDPDDADTPARVWEFIREGAAGGPSAHSEDVAQAAAEQVARYKNLTDAINQQVDDSLDELADEDEWGDASFDPSQFSRIMGEDTASVFAEAINSQIALAIG